MKTQSIEDKGIRDIIVYYLGENAVYALSPDISDLSRPMPEFEYCNYTINTTYKKTARAFRVEHIKSGISISSTSGRTLLINTIRACRLMSEIYPSVREICTGQD